tara:strand:+ start:415 stop:675 length:261 start_codon:yes stop_codon:yes gene_type:complete
MKQRPILKTINYKNHKINIYEQEADLKNPPKEPNGEIKGSHRYEVLNTQNEVIWSDNKDMWDEGACIENGKQDVDVSILGEEEKNG